MNDHRKGAVVAKKRAWAEADWSDAVLVAGMFDCLRDRGLMDDRKLRLFAAACCRQAWDWLGDGRSRQAVEAAERLADGAALPGEAEAAEEGAMAALERACTATGHDIRDVLRRSPAVFDRRLPGAIRWACAAALAAGRRAEAAAWAAEGVASRKELAANCGLMRCIFGNPFRPTAVKPAWRTPTVSGLAREVYEDRQLPAGTLDPERLAVLADALEEAGAVAELVEHLRGPGPHVRGCHVIDWLTGRS